MKEKLNFKCFLKEKSVYMAAWILIFSASSCVPVVSYMLGNIAYEFIPEYNSGNDFGYSSEEYNYPMESQLEGRIRQTIHGCSEDQNTKYFKDYLQCGVYHSCTGPEKNRKLQTHYCTGEKSYDELLQDCVDTPSCSNTSSYPANQGNYLCLRDYHQGRTFENCSNYYTCHWTGKYYTLTFHTCREPGNFDEDQLYFYTESELAGCLKYNYYNGECPQRLTADLQQLCKNKTGEDLFYYWPIPNSCTEYYRCLRIENQFLKFTCPEGTIYNNNKTNPDCIPGPCSPKEKPLPKNFTCAYVDDFNPHPTDCRSYYKCHACKGSYETNNWCYYYFETCPVQHRYDEIWKKCVYLLNICPKDLIKLPSENGWHCERNGDRNVHPQDCRQYYQCLNCSKEGGWCYYKLEQCDSDMHFDQEYGICVETSVCPQDWKQLPKEDGWNCTAENEVHVVPNKCNAYYKCHACESQSRPWKNWCYIEYTCPKGQTFHSDQKPYCDYGRCPDWPPYLPQGWNCTEKNQLNVNPTNCHEYYKCLPCPDDHPWCIQHEKCAKDGHWFDDFNKNCSSNPVGICPQEFLELPDNVPGFQCEQERETHVSPEDCTRYYTCVKCKKSPNGWCYTPTVQCDGGGHFDNTTKNCTNSQVCPQNLTELPYGNGWECEEENQLNAMPNNCSAYYSCHKCDRPRKWCYLQLECPPGQTFNDMEISCFVGRCPSYPPILPQNWTCESENELNVDPTNCRKSYKCLRCPDDQPWCYKSIECSHDKYFDDFQKSCVDRKFCPQEYPELPTEPGWNCKENEINVHPMDCTMFYSCHRCTKPSGWCYEAERCSPGRYFHQGVKRCIKSKVCPQTFIELPPTPGWECIAEEDRNVVPDNCTSFYTCYFCDDRRSKWCYTLQSCPDGQSFHELTGQCTTKRCEDWPDVLPSGWNCSVANERRVDPKDCTKSYKCLKCPDSDKNPWCYEPPVPCPPNHWFDDILKECVMGSYCPQRLIEIGNGSEWSCTKQGERNVLPAACSKFYTCLSCSKPRKWCYSTEESCPSGSNFDQFQRRCTLGICPQTRPPITNGFTCRHVTEVHVLPTDCSKYYTCHKCSKGWCYEEHKCPGRQTFDESRKTCVASRCAQLDPIIPPNWQCTKHGEVNVVPTDCSKYFTCLSCKDGPFCYKGVESCPRGQTFDNTNKRCVKGRCAQYPPRLPNTWSCREKGEQHVHPANCSSFYTCVPCPDIRAWCYTLANCSSGEMYDDKAKRCVKETKCPQLPTLLPPGWKCYWEGEMHVHPEDCSKFYTCKRFSTGWAVTIEACPAGQYFYETGKSCWAVPRCPQDPIELPQGWVCERDGGAKTHPEDCTQFYVCIWVPKPADGKPPYWSYSASMCNFGQNFDEVNQRCRYGPCSTDGNIRRPLPPGWICIKEGELMVHPEDCRSYYKCLRFNNQWSYQLKKCPEGRHFDNMDKFCRIGDCPQNLASLPDNWMCTTAGAKEVHPYDCSRYYTCMQCMGGTILQTRFGVQTGRSNVIRNSKCFGGIGVEGSIVFWARGVHAGYGDHKCGWCYRGPYKCPYGHMFSKSRNGCVRSRTCPQRLGWSSDILENSDNSGFRTSDYF